MQYFLITLLTFTFIYAQEDGEVVKNVTASQRTDGSGIIDIYYAQIDLVQLVSREKVKGTWQQNAPTLFQKR